VLARTLEAAGISTVLVTMMPWWAERFGTPRTLGVEFPFGHPLGLPDERELQLRVLRRALALLRDATEPGAVEHLDEPWPGDQSEWYKRWQPSEPSPIIAWLRAQAQERARERRSEGS
jgi:D-proline reductase (dithiol) PrdB